MNGLQHIKITNIKFKNYEEDFIIPNSNTNNIS